MEFAEYKAVRKIINAHVVYSDSLDLLVYIALNARNLVKLSLKLS